jgi:hypothetical protein
MNTKALALKLVTDGALWAALLAVLMYHCYCTRRRTLYLRDKDAIFVTIPLGVGLFITGMIAYAMLMQAGISVSDIVTYGGL